MSQARPDLPPLASLRPWVDRFAGLHVVVWGDVVADRFVYGQATRVSREAPALVLQYEGEEVRPGGAGNAMVNAASLGARVTAVGFVGDDPTGRRLRRALAEAGVTVEHLVPRADGHTPVKTRVMAGGLHTVRQQVLRIDQDRPWRHDAASQRQLAERLHAALEGADALLISDYGLGAAAPRLYLECREELLRRGLPVTLDSRRALLQFPRVTAATPNEGEVEEALRVRLDGRLDTLERVGRELLGRLESAALVITRGSCGMAVFEPRRPPLHLPIHGTDEIADVTGAGDAVIAALTLGLAAGAPTVDAARLANVAGGLAVMKRGTAPVPGTELRGALEQG